MREKALSHLKVAYTLLEDGAPADALRAALQACQALLNLVSAKYIPGAR